ncbi:hypothetical protein AB0M31_33415 [Streptomyces sp. NPDC051773]|uniref:hypothetical protein n=1 Tax=Streptomyces sp. NPDC051773 TaxID=3156682 RepID=UPI00343FC2EA
MGWIGGGGGVGVGVAGDTGPEVGVPRPMRRVVEEGLVVVGVDVGPGVGAVARGLAVARWITSAALRVGGAAAVAEAATLGPTVVAPRLVGVALRSGVAEASVPGGVAAVRLGAAVARCTAVGPEACGVVPGAVRGVAGLVGVVP